MYAKVYGSLFDGSMRGKSDLILVFVNMLCRCNPDGIDDRHPKSIAEETGLRVDRVRQALLRLEKEDSDSRTNTDDGKRIKRLDPHRDWGWVIINYAKYRWLRDESEKRAYMRDYMRRRREGQPVNPNVKRMLTDVNHVSHSKERLAQESESKSESKSPSIPQEGEERGRGFEHSLDEALAGLRGTGKFPNLEVEHLALIQQSFPMALLAEHWKAIAEEARALPSNVVGNPFAWLRKRLDEVEQKVVKGETGRAKDAERPVFQGVS